MGGQVPTLVSREKPLVLGIWGLVLLWVSLWGGRPGWTVWTELGPFWW